MSNSSKKMKIYYESIIEKGYSCRDFIKFTTYMTAFMGFEASMIGQITKAMETKKRIPVIWLHFQECTGWSELFIRSEHPLAADLILAN